MRSLQPPKLIVITDLTRISPEALLARASQLAALAAPGSLAVLLRDHETSARARLELGHELRAVTLASGQELWVADRLDLALTLQADALHLGEGSVTAAQARKLLGGQYRISRAWHSAEPIDDNAARELYGVDVLLVSPILEARKGRPALGVAALGVLADALLARGHAAKLMALGGVTAATASSCVTAGAWGVAVMGAAWSPEPVDDLVRALGLAR